MAHPQPESLLHSSGSTTNRASTALSTSVSSCESMRRTADDDFSSHVKQLVEAFQALAGEVEALRKQYRSVDYVELDCLTKGRTSVDHICRCMGWDLGTREKTDYRENTHNPSSAELEQLEVDFTTNGKASSLACPFAAMGGSNPPQRTPVDPQQPRNGLPASPESKVCHFWKTSDPITAELHGTSLTSPPPSTSASISKCPIRYLDQHSPEEVAQYFESHKHELPRSHEVCVRRYQSNEESIRQLDAKYGDLVSMIKGLGVTHKPLLPAKDGDEDDGVAMEQEEENGRLEKWAEGVDGTYGEAVDRVAAEESDGYRGRDRDVKSDRLLKEVRVGESPSRPWGIPIPPPESPKLVSGPPEHEEPTEASATNPSTSIPGQEANTKRKACPIRTQQPHTHQQQQQDQSQPHHQTPAPDPKSPPPAIQFMRNAAFISTPSAAATPTTASKATAPQMLFTGPVFIGYSVEQVVALLGQRGGGGGGDD